MKKRFWALLLAVMMVVSVLPTAAFAVDGDALEQVPSVSTDEDSPVKITKSVNDTGDRLTMEAYVTGQVVTTNPEPLDIVLVLDVSGSMKDDISIVKEENVTYSPVANREPIWFFFIKFDTNTNSYVCSDWENGGEYWYSEDGKTFYPVTKIERKERKELAYDLGIGQVYDIYVRYEYTYTVDGKDKVYATNEYESEGLNGILGNAADDEVVQRIYYKTVKTTTQTVSKMKALQDAVKEFISATAEKNQNVDAASQHRISIVKFAGDSTDEIGNGTYDSGRYKYNYSQIVENLTVVDETGAETLSDTVDALQAAGATAADYGMAHAKTVLNNRPEEEKTRKQVVIFFTDGEPNHHNGFDTGVANTAIGHAKDLKADGATIYTIGVFAGADPTEIRSNANKFMHAVSSNYPDARSMGNLGDRADDSDYYQTAATQNDLTDIFGDIAKDMIPDVTAGSTSVLTDTVSDWFIPVIPEDESVEAVTVEVWSATGTDEKPSWNPDPNADTTKIDVEIVGPKISVTGFDYAANALAKQNGSWTGKKLVISFAIAPNADAEWEAGNHLYPTNVAGADEEDNAGLYPESGKAFASLDRSPTVPVTAYSVTYSYSGGAPTDAPPVPDDEVYLPGTEVTVVTAPTLPGYSFSGWTTKANVGISENKFTMPECAVALTGSWSENPPATTYSVTYNWTGLPDSEKVYTGTGDEKVEVTLPEDDTEYADDAPYTIDTTYTGATVAYTTDDDGNVKDRYIFSGWDKTDGTIVKENVAVNGTWYLDNWHDANPNDPEDKDSDKGGDGIPDKYQAVIKYVSENDANGNLKGNVSFAQEVVTVKDEIYFRFPVANGKIEITGSKATAADGYLFENWTSDENLTFEGASVAELTGQRINGVQGGRTYTFTAHFDEAIPGLELSKTVKSIGGVAVSGSELPMAVEGDVIVWTISVKNTGNCSLKDITVTDVLKDEDGNVLSGVSVFPVGTYGNIGNELDLTFTIGDYLAAGDTAVYEARYTVTANDAGKTLINSVSAAGAGSMDAPGVTVKNPALSVTKTVNKTSVTVGDTVKYTITVKNTGNVDLTNVNVVEAFGGDFSKITNVTGADQVTNTGFVIRELKAGSDPVEITFSYKTTKRETLTNSVKVTGTYESGKTVEDEDSSAPVTVKSEPITPVGPSKPQLNYEDHYAYVVGYPDGLVHPERNITRAEVATIFFRMLLDESREYFWAQENDFSDVAETDWFNNAVSTLANAQLINGYPDGSYRPNANITRAEFATIAIRFFLDEDVEIEENNLSDVKGHWAEANINLAYALELINGYPDGTFRPDQKITRAEAMAIVNRVLKRAPEKDHLLKDMIEWPDNLNTAAWYYADVQEATNSHKFHMDKEEEYEIWTELLPVRDWVALEQEWSKANSSKNPGEVVDIKITTPEAGDNGLKLD